MHYVVIDAIDAVRSDEEVTPHEMMSLYLDIAKSKKSHCMFVRYVEKFVRSGCGKAEIFWQRCRHRGYRESGHPQRVASPFVLTVGGRCVGVTHFHVRDEADSVALVVDDAHAVLNRCEYHDLLISLHRVGLPCASTLVLAVMSYPISAARKPFLL